ncbi:AmpG family muropeptide MFS transporter [Tumidithrix elongata RA019]|uniref:AmpG family muropeptide MFS transporter n=2 Tax=Tumidithrix TaxID=3088355 RepID=A0AAW9PWJ7_9CYAN|nr:AmpG family muropeptide MFS transporter [Tumidithrix elongata RA019]
MAALLLLGFSSGLPYALTDDAFRAWMTKAQLDLSTIGLLGLINLPYSLKFLWAPFIDRFVPPFLGRRRGWMVITQVGLLLAILLISAQMASLIALPVTERSGALGALTITALAIAFLSATQDIVIDAYRTDVLEERELGAGAGIWTAGYRAALILTGVIGFNLADRISWHWVYALMAILMAVGIFTATWSPEPVRPATPPETLDRAVIGPFLEFFRRLGWQQVVLTLIFIILYRLGDAMVSKMAVPFLGGKGLGFSDADIGNVRQGLGLFATIVGTLTGGAILSQIGINRSLWIFGFLQAVSNLGYYALAIAGKNLYWLIAAINVENFCGGLGTAAFLGFLMSLCNPSFSATQFALFSSLFAVGRDLLASPAAGEIAQRLQQYVPTQPALSEMIYLAGSDRKGWPLFFLITLIAAIPGLLLLPFFAPWNTKHDANLDDG